MKIAIAQINPTVGDFDGNAEKILDAAIALYYRYYQQSPHMDMNSPWRTASERYRLGSRLIELLQETGKEAAAKKIAGELDPQAKKDKPKK